jgi:pyruvate kinase
MTSLATRALRHTKIIATVGPASSPPSVLRELLSSGVDVFRLNFSHGNHASHAATYRDIREAAAASGRTVGIMQDLSGPKIRTGPLQGGAAIQLENGETLRLGAGDHPGGPGRIFTPYAPLITSARPGDRLLLDDGRIELSVTGTEGEEIVTTVVNGGLLGQNKGINAPGVALPASAVTEKDEHDLRFGLELGVDMVALSFVQTAEDVLHALGVMEGAGRVVPIIAKIERPQAVDNLADIIRVASGIMVARGDLGLEMPLEQVPRVQKHVIRSSRAAGLPVILATQVLESMRVEPRPTRAEVSDAAKAVDEGADAIMLAGETAAGQFPVRAVQTLDAVIRDAEQLLPGELVVPQGDVSGRHHGRALCEAAVTLASTARADAIVAVTRGGKTPRLLASLRPMTQVFSATDVHAVAGWSALLWGITPLMTQAAQMTPALAPSSQLEELETILIEAGLIQRGALLVFVNVNADLGRTDANFIHVRHVR